MATEDYYLTRGYDSPRLVHQGNSSYHSVEVIDTYWDLEQTQLDQRVSFINGVRFFRYIYSDGEFAEESNLSEFSFFLAELPAPYLSQTLGRPRTALLRMRGSPRSRI